MTQKPEWEKAWDATPDRKAYTPSSIRVFKLGWDAAMRSKGNYSEFPNSCHEAGYVEALERVKEEAVKIIRLDSVTPDDAPFKELANALRNLNDLAALPKPEAKVCEECGGEGNLECEGQFGLYAKTCPSCRGKGRV